MQKDMTPFLKQWISQAKIKNKSNCVHGYMTKKGIADKFAAILAHISTHNSEKRNLELKCNLE